MALPAGEAWHKAIPRFQSGAEPQRELFVMVGFFIPVARAALLGLALVAAAAAQAQQPSPAALASARELMELKGVKSLVEPVVSGVIQQTTGTILQTNPGLTKDLQEVSTQLRNEYQPRVAEMT